MNTKTVYKIRRKSDGLFSMGGSWPSFNKNGKIWKQKGHLTSHLNLIFENCIRTERNHYDDCEIVAYQLIEMPIGPAMSIEQYMHIAKQKKDEKLRKQQEYREKVEKQKRLAQYEKLKQEFDE